MCLTWNLTCSRSERVQLPSGQKARYKTHNHSHLPSIKVCQVSFPPNASFGLWKNMRTAHGKYPGPPSSSWLVFILSRNNLFLFSFHRICTNVISENRKRFKGTLWGLYHWQNKIWAGMETSSRKKHPCGRRCCSAMSWHKLNVIVNKRRIRSRDSRTIPPLWVWSNGEWAVSRYK